MGNAVRDLDPDFNLLQGLLGKAEDVLGSSTGAGAESGARPAAVRGLRADVVVYRLARGISRSGKL